MIFKNVAYKQKNHRYTYVSAVLQVKEYVYAFTNAVYTNVDNNLSFSIGAPSIGQC
jgi:hypothetical protein